MQRRRCYLCLGMLGLSSMAVADDATVRVARQTAMTACVAGLPSPLRRAFQEPRLRRTLRVPSRLRHSWRACLAKERDLADQEAIIALRDRLVALQPAVQRGVARAEAEAIALQLVRETRQVGAQYNMVGSPLFNNFLVHIGAKQAGFCYHWTATLARALTALPWKYFSRQWGVANLAEATENNALVITARGAPLTSGIVYDPWRGAGTPHWRGVADDHYRWTTRYTERNLEMGVGLDVAPRLDVAPNGVDEP